MWKNNNKYDNGYLNQFFIRCSMSFFLWRYFGKKIKEIVYNYVHGE